MTPGVNSDGSMDTAIETLDVSMEVSFQFRNRYDLTTPEWQALLSQGTQTFMNELEKQVHADIRDEVASHTNLSHITMNFNRRNA